MLFCSKVIAKKSQKHAHTPIAVPAPLNWLVTEWCLVLVGYAANELARIGINILAELRISIPQLIVLVYERSTTAATAANCAEYIHRIRRERILTNQDAAK